MNYAIIKRTYELDTEVFYCDTLEQAIRERTRLIFQRAAEKSEYAEWTIHRNVDDLTDSKLWRWATKWADWKALKARW